MREILVATKKKERGLGELLKQEKSIDVPNIIVLWDRRRYWGTVGDALRKLFAIDVRASPKTEKKSIVVPNITVLWDRRRY
jgi:hypothetical protein